MRNNMALFVASFALSGCNTVASDPAVGSAVDYLAKRPITCQSGPDCEAKWSRATAWVAKNGAYKIQTTSDSLIQTMGPLPSDPRPAYTVLKTASADGSGFQITLDGGCDNFLGCVPTIPEARASLASFVETGGASPTIPHKGQNIGLIAVPLTTDAATQLKMSEARGLIVVRTLPGSAAEVAGLMKNDVLLSANNHVLATMDDLKSVMDGGASSHKLSFDVLRAGSKQTLSVPF
jgi:hypothetical protein